MSRTTIEITGDARHLEATFDKLEAKQRAQDAGYKQMADSGTQSSRQVAAANEASANKGVESYNRVLRELRKTGPEGRAAAQAVERHLQATGTAGRRDMASIVDELKELDPAAAEAATAVEEHLQDAGGKGESTFARLKGSAVGQITAIAGSVVTIQKAFELVASAQRKVLETNRQIFDGLKETASGDRRLLQVAESTEDFNALRDTADRLAQEHGIGREEARQLVFSARSEGFEDALDFIAGNQQVVSTTAQATVAGQVPGLFSGQDLSPAAAINATLTAAAASRLDFESIARALPGAAASAAPGGSTAEETIGTLSVLAGKFKGGDQAADRISALASALQLDPRTRDQGIIEGFQTISALPEDEQAEFLGKSKELNQVFAAMTDSFEEIEERIRMIDQAVAETGTGSSLIERRRADAQADPRLAAQVSVAAAETRLQIERESRRAVPEGQRRAAMSEVLGDAERRDAAPIKVAIAEMAADTVTGFGGGAAAPLVADTLTRPSAFFAGPLGFQVALMQSIEDQMRKMAGGVERSNALIDEQTETLREQSAAAKETAQNTRPRPADPSGAIRDAAAAADARSP